MAEPEINHLLEAALSYARRGWRVIPLQNLTAAGVCTCQSWRDSKAMGPCPTPGKHPRFAGWKDQATTDPGKITNWWKANPEANVGILSGPGSGVVILDKDPRNGGEESRQSLIYGHEKWDWTVTAATGGGGSHEYFQCPEGIILPGMLELDPGLELLLLDHIVVMPPSLHPSGRRYRWEPELAPEECAVQPLPVWLLEVIRGKLAIAAGQSSTAGGSADKEKSDFPVANYAKVLEGCGWMRHCAADARGLGEPEWYAQLSIVGRCEEGEKLAHEVSQPHSGYSAAATAAKLRHALEGAGPVTCAKVRHSLGGARFCDECPSLGRVKSPIVLGTDRSRSVFFDFSTNPTDEEAARYAGSRGLHAEGEKPKPVDVDQVHQVLEESLAAEDQAAIMTMAPLFAQLEETQWSIVKAKIGQKFGKKFRFKDLEKAVRAEKTIRARVIRDEAETDWETQLIRSDKGAPVANLANAITALKYAPEWKDVLWRDDFAEATVARKALPVRAPVGRWSNLHDILTADWLQHQGINVSEKVAGLAAEAVAYDHRFHPPRDYLKGLAWDGTQRLHRWLEDYLGVRTETGKAGSYFESVGMKWLISAVARVFSPGCKVDCALVLEGVQGTKKSSALRVMGGEWFTDQLEQMGSKDSSMQTHGIWIIEIGEMGSMNKAEVEIIKAFMSRQTERYRPPYSGRLVELPRQCVFAGTVNGQSYLRDETGGRRFWPVECSRIDLKTLQRDRDQIWAEATARYLAGTTWWLDDPEVNLLAQAEQADRYRDDPWSEKVRQFILSLEEVTIDAILQGPLEIPVGRWGQAEANRIAAVLTFYGWKKHRLRENGQRKYVYRPHTEAAKLASAKQLEL